MYLKSRMTEKAGDRKQGKGPAAWCSTPLAWHRLKRSTCHSSQASLGASSAALPAALAGSRMESGANRTPTGTALWDECSTGCGLTYCATMPALNVYLHSIFSTQVI